MRHAPLSTIRLLPMGPASVMVAGGRSRVYIRPNGGWGPYTLQAFGLVILVPTILALAVTKALSTEILATLLGGVAGYIFGRGSGGGDGGGRPGL